MKIVMRDYVLDLGARCHVMGILNVTPDSFWDGGKHCATEQAIAQAARMVKDGADIIDVGGESTRPSSAPVEAQDEVRRIAPVVEEMLRSFRIPISIDTRKAAVTREMLSLGAHMINDVSGLAFDGGMSAVVREYDVPVVLMHMRGTPQNMQSLTDYGDVVADVKRELAERVRVAEEAGIRSEKILIDPGIGFAKTADQCVEIIARLDEFSELERPVVVGPSMKSFMGKTLGLEPGDRLEATLACCLVAATKGASIVRVHEVGSTAKALAMLDEIGKWSNRERRGVLR